MLLSWPRYFYCEVHVLVILTEESVHAWIDHSLKHLIGISEESNPSAAASERMAMNEATVCS